jgi:Domain of unknown function (DUF4145)
MHRNTKRGNNASRKSQVRDMECPYCLVAIAPVFYPNLLLPNVSDKPGKNCIVYSAVCPACEGRIIYNQFVDRLGFRLPKPLSTKEFEKVQDTSLLFPKRKKPRQFSSDVPPRYVKDYEEAFAVLDVSAKASAALSRRLLQRLLWDKGIKKSNLAEEIKEAIRTRHPPPDTAKVIDNVRFIGNLAAHPLRTAAGQIVNVKPGEAKWSLNVLELLFDWYFVEPAKAKRMQNALKQKSNRLKKSP